MTSLQLSNYDNVYLTGNNISTMHPAETSPRRGETDLLRPLELFLEQGGCFLDNTVKQSIVYVLQNQRNLYKNKKECQQLIQSLSRSLSQMDSTNLFNLKLNLIKLLRSSMKNNICV